MGPISKYSFIMIELITKRNMIFISKTHFLERSELSLKECKVWTIDPIYKYITDIFMLKYNRGLLSNIFDNVFMFNTVQGKNNETQKVDANISTLTTLHCLSVQSIWCKRHSYASACINIYYYASACLHVTRSIVFLPISQLKPLN